MPPKVSGYHRSSYNRNLADVTGWPDRKRRRTMIRPLRFGGITKRGSPGPAGVLLWEPFAANDRLWPE